MPLFVTLNFELLSLTIGKLNHCQFLTLRFVDFSSFPISKTMNLGHRLKSTTVWTSAAIRILASVRILSNVWILVLIYIGHRPVVQIMVVVKVLSTVRTSATNRISSNLFSITVRTTDYL